MKVTHLTSQSYTLDFAPDVAPLWVTLSIRPIGVAFAWPVGKRDVILVVCQLGSDWCIIPTGRQNFLNLKYFTS